VGEFITFWCEISSGFRTPKRIKIGSVFRRVIQNLKASAFFETQYIQGGPKSKPLPNDQKSYYIVSKPGSEIRFARQIKE